MSELKCGILVAPSAALAWGWALSGFGPGGIALGACAGGVVGFFGGWAFGRLVARAGQAERKWGPGLVAIGFLVVLWLGLVILPAVLSAGVWSGFPKADLRALFQ